MVKLILTVIFAGCLFISCSRHDKVATDDSEIPEYENDVSPAESMPDTVSRDTVSSNQNNR